MNLLVSEAYLCRSPSLMRLTKRAALRGHAIMIDSGAFTNYADEKKGEPPKVTLDSYIGRCRDEYEHWAWGYVMLDKVRDADASKRNLAEMVRAGLRPMPVLTTDEQASEIRDLVALNPRVCVAGAVYARDEWIVKRYLDAFEASDGKARIHGLGYGRIPDLFGLPIATCDSSAASNGGQWGNYFLYSRTKGMTTYRKDTLAQVRPMRYLAKCGLTASRINQPGHWKSGDQSLGSMVTFAAYCTFADHATQLGYRYFIACTAAQSMASVLAVYHSMRADGTFDYAKAQVIRRGIIDGMRIPYREPLFGTRCWDDEP